MSSKKWQDATIILERLKKAYSLKNDAKLANFLDVKPNTIATWKKRNSIDFPLIFAKCHDLNLNWLLTGQGPMFLTEQAPGGINERSAQYQTKAQEIERLKKEIAILKEELKKMDQDEKKDAARLTALENKIKELELKNRELSGKVDILKELLLKKA